MKFISLIVILLFTSLKVQLSAQTALDNSQADYFCTQLGYIESSEYFNDSGDIPHDFAEYIKSLHELNPKSKQITPNQLRQTIGYIAYQYATCYSIEKHPEHVKRWLQLSKEYGHKEAELGLARIVLIYGDELQLEREAAELLNKRLINGIEHESMPMAIAYLTGRGVEINNNLGIKYMEMAAKRGHTLGQFFLAYVYEYGLYGIPKDAKQRQYWMDFSPKNYESTLDCSIKNFVEYGVLELGETEAALIKECDRIEAEEETTP